MADQSPLAQEQLRRTRTLPAHLLRVADEQIELDVKRHRLHGFFDTTTFRQLPDVDKLLLQAQYSAMTAYSDALAARLARHFEQEARDAATC